MADLHDIPIIRDATEDDIPSIVVLGEYFYHEAGWHDVAEWDAQSITLTLHNLVKSDDGILVVLSRKGVISGMAGGLVYPLYFNMHHRTGQELFWWVSPEERIGAGRMLLETLEERARDRGADSWAMVALDRVRPTAVAALYQRRGYRASEHTYIKRLAV